MWFKTQHLGSDYIRIAMDVHRDQIGEIIRAIASTQVDDDDAPAAGMEDFGSETVVDHAEPAAKVDERDGDLLVPAERLRVFGAELLGHGSHDESVLRAGQSHDRSRGDEETLQRPVAGVQRNGAWLTVADHVQDCVTDGAGPLTGGLPLSDKGIDFVDVERDHEDSFGGCRCAGAAQADAQGVTEPTERPASLEDVVELLGQVVDRMGPKPFAVDFSSAGRAAAWLRVSDEDACRAVDAEDDTEFDCEGPGAEGVDGGEDR